MTELRIEHYDLGLIVPFTLLALVGILYSYSKALAPKKDFRTVPSAWKYPVRQYIRSFQYIFLNDKPLHYITHFLYGLCKLYWKEGIVSLPLVKTYVGFFKAETVEIIVSSPDIIDKSSEYYFTEIFLGSGLLTSNGDTWRRHRKMLTSSFHFNILKDFLPVFNECSQVLVEELNSLTKEPWVDVFHLMFITTVRVISKTAMGVDLNTVDGGYEKYGEAITEMSKCFMDRFFRPWIWNDWMFYCSSFYRNMKSHVIYAQDISSKLIKQKKEQMKQKDFLPDVDFYGVKKKQAFLELLLELHLKDESSFTEQDIQDEVNTFTAAGYDTTTAGLSWVLYMLGLHPEIQEKVCQEQDSIFADDPSRAVTSDDLAQMKYLECVMKESFRLYSPVPVFMRHINKDIEVLNYVVKAGSVAVILADVLHKDPKWFPNPELFDPDRFLPVNYIGRHPYAFIPFSAGPRNCIGQKFAFMEMKVILSYIFRNFNLESLDQRDRVHIVWEITTTCTGPLRVKFTPRRRASVVSL